MQGGGWRWSVRSRSKGAAWKSPLQIPEARRRARIDLKAGRRPTQRKGLAKCHQHQNDEISGAVRVSTASLTLAGRGGDPRIRPRADMGLRRAGVRACLRATLGAGVRRGGVLGRVAHLRRNAAAVVLVLWSTRGVEPRVLASFAAAEGAALAPVSPGCQRTVACPITKDGRWIDQTIDLISMSMSRRRARAYVAGCDHVNHVVHRYLQRRTTCSVQRNREDIVGQSAYCLYPGWARRQRA